MLNAHRDSQANIDQISIKIKINNNGYITYWYYHLPGHFLNIKGKECTVLLATSLATTEHIHTFTINNRGMMTDGIRSLVVFAWLGLHKLPFKIPFLIFRLLV